MVPIRSNPQKCDLLPCGALHAEVPKHRIYLRREHRPAVLGRTDSVVEQDGDIVANVERLPYILSLSHHTDAASCGE